MTERLEIKPVLFKCTACNSTGYTGDAIKHANDCEYVNQVNLLNLTNDVNTWITQALAGCETQGTRNWPGTKEIAKHIVAQLKYTKVI